MQTIQKSGFGGRILSFLAASLVLAAVTPLAYSQNPKEPTGLPKPRELDPRDAWVAAIPRLIQADRESTEAAENRLQAVCQYLEDRKAGARPFAEAVFSLNGKMAYTGGLTEQAFNSLGELFGAKPSASNSFNSYVRDCFRTHVLGDKRELQRVIDDAIAGYVSDMKAVEAQLLIDLRADLADDALAIPESLPKIASMASVDMVRDRVIARVVEDAGTDFAAFAATTLGSYFAGNALAGKATSKTDSTAKKAVTNFATGMLVDKAIEDGLVAAGYDPKAKVTDLAIDSLDAICQLLVEGNDERYQQYIRMFSLSIGHPNERVRLACLRAVEILETSPFLGLRAPLGKLQSALSQRRAVAIYRTLFGPDAEVPESLIHPRKISQNLPPDEDVIRMAEENITRFGGDNR